MGAYRRIESKAYHATREEYTVGETGIYPGMIVELSTATAVVKHATEGGLAEAMLVLESALEGKTVDDVYAYSADQNNKVEVLLPRKGEEVNVLVASGETVAVNASLVSAGDGTVKVSTNVSSGVTVEAGAVVFKALEASDGALAADTLMKARVI